MSRLVEECAACGSRSLVPHLQVKGETGADGLAPTASVVVLTTVAIGASVAKLLVLVCLVCVPELMWFMGLTAVAVAVVPTTANVNSAV